MHLQFSSSPLNMHLQLSSSHLESTPETHCQYITIVGSHSPCIRNRNQIFFQNQTYPICHFASCVSQQESRKRVIGALPPSGVSRHAPAVLAVAPIVLLLDILWSSLLKIFRIRIDLAFLNIRTDAYKLLSRHFYVIFSLCVADLDERVRTQSKFGKFRLFDIVTLFCCCQFSLRLRNWSTLQTLSDIIDLLNLLERDRSLLCCRSPGFRVT